MNEHSVVIGYVVYGFLAQIVLPASVGLAGHILAALIGVGLWEVCVCLYQRSNH